MPTEDLGQEPTSTPPAGQTPAEPPAEQPAKQQLVDVSAKDEHGHQLWFPREAIEQVRQEAANYRNLLKEAKQALEALKSPAEPDKAKEPEKTQDSDIAQRLAQLEARERELVIENAILAAAAARTEERGAFIRPAEAVRLIDRVNVKLTDDGKVEGVEDALKALAAQSPHLLAQDGKRARVSATNPGAPGNVTPAIVQQIQARMSGQTNPFGGGGVEQPEE